MTYGREGTDDWEFEDAVLSEFEDPVSLNGPARGDDVPSDDGNGGADADDAHPVLVHVTESGIVTSVSLAPNWKRSVDPRELGATVVAAANTAVMQAFADQDARADASARRPCEGGWLPGRNA
ncbi:hypothetical protein GCM10025787_49020 [Saccharopolyspora rosea]|uniref:YbaB/EbfC DNA-binding family protein n=1 Tax=Saccharopolyspora rosea TaxID=524884 RepID=A0ABW3FWV8_9PSEU